MGERQANDSGAHGNSCTTVRAKRLPVQIASADAGRAQQVCVIINLTHAAIYKPLNLLVDEAWTVKIADFGLSSFKYRDEGTEKHYGTVLYMANEVIYGPSYDESSDVFSFGIILYEWMHKRDHPAFSVFKDMSEAFEVIREPLECKRGAPAVPPWWHPVVGNALRATLAKAPSDRPSFEELLEELAALPRDNPDALNEHAIDVLAACAAAVGARERGEALDGASETLARDWARFGGEEALRSLASRVTAAPLAQRALDALRLAGCNADDVVVRGSRRHIDTTLTLEAMRRSAVDSDASDLTGVIFSSGGGDDEMSSALPSDTSEVTQGGKSTPTAGLAVGGLDEGSDDDPELVAAHHRAQALAGNVGSSAVEVTSAADMMAPPTDGTGAQRASLSRRVPSNADGEDCSISSLSALGQAQAAPTPQQEQSPSAHPPSSVPGPPTLAGTMSALHASHGGWNTPGEVSLPEIRWAMKEYVRGRDLDDLTTAEILKAVEEQLGVDVAMRKRELKQIAMLAVGEADCASQILNWLYLGSKWNAGDEEELTRLGVGFVVNATQRDELDAHEGVGAGERLLRQELRVEVEDQPIVDISPHLARCVAFLEVARLSGRAALVHCYRGMSRSATIVVAYLMWHNRWPLQQALAHCEERRPVTQPNPGFRDALVALSRRLQSANFFWGEVDALVHRSNELEGGDAEAQAARVLACPEVFEADASLAVRGADVSLSPLQSPAKESYLSRRLSAELQRGGASGD